MSWTAFLWTEALFAQPIPLGCHCHSFFALMNHRSPSRFALFQPVQEGESNMLASSLFVLAAALAFANALTLFAKNEAIRGAGRIIGGLAWLSFGAFLLVAPVAAGSIALYTPLSWLVVLVGVITLGSGVRKYARRNAVQ
jgi:hypothetical protein